MNLYVKPSQLVTIDLNGTQRRVLFEQARHRVTIEWFGTRIAGCFADPVEAAAFRARYESFLAAGSPDMWICAVRDHSGETFFWTEPGAAWRYAGSAPLRKPGLLAFLADAVAQKAYFAVNHLILSFHAAALQIDDVAIAISAISTGGKTTTAIACVRRGMGLYTDERCVVMGGCIHPFPRALTVRKESLDMLASEQVRGDGGVSDRLRRHIGADWKFATFANLFGNEQVPEPRPLKAIFFIEGRSNAARVIQVTRADATTRLLRSALCGPALPLDRLAAATEVFQHARGYALVLGSPDETALLIADTVRESEPLMSASSG